MNHIDIMGNILFEGQTVYTKKELIYNVQKSNIMNKLAGLVRKFHINALTVNPL